MGYGIRACPKCGNYKDLSLISKTWYRKLNIFMYGYCIECTREVSRIAAKKNYTVERGKIARAKRHNKIRAESILQTRNLADCYIKKLLCVGNSLLYSDIPQSLIETKRQQLKLMREARK